MVLWNLDDPGTALKAKVEQAVETYGKLSCRAICEPFPTKLPRELRDEVYDLLVGEAGPALMKSLMWTLNYNAKDIPFRSETVQLRFIANPDFVSQPVAKEIAEQWYRKMRFGIRHHEFEQFTRYDAWGQGLKPAELVNHVQIAVDERDCELLRGRLVLLRRFKPSCRVIIWIRSNSLYWDRDYAWSDQKSERLIEGLEPLIRGLRECNDAGRNLEVWWGYNDQRRVDLTIVECSKDGWLKKIREVRAKRP
ncbi:hypothetical protein BU26DRAFT_564086 [Trematosphaeria pertusa]|uniref:Uncharacterized protein n=1 Tax=Trematosphaeria pertusa TaxID=390896 RepID=A0A6A6IJ09_9PLEO|nr:uncharacterized protein BU26DRAFT_564086 [Trematosphaeria pertusa]KAF2250209.1 hypothetical protein BU26DRAFT_564086 [Trematosphaeria pertusa]